MPMDKKVDVDIMDIIWKDVRKINWKKINKEALKTFLLVIIGNETTFENVMDALESTSYDFMNIKHKKKIPLSYDADILTIKVLIDSESEYEAIVKNADIIIADQNYYSQLKNSDKKTYLFSTDEKNVVLKRILTENNHLKQALCYNYPGFRSIAAKETMVNYSLKNTKCATGISVSNILTGPHSIFVAPLKGTSDFSIITYNELMMIYILTSISGRIVNPFQLIPEIIPKLDGAKGIQILATQVYEKVPSGTGTFYKAGVAFAFTYAIGEAVFLNLNYGITFDKTNLIKRVEKLQEYGEEMAKDSFSNFG